jgi:hypothetical protein
MKEEGDTMGVFERIAQSLPDDAARGRFNQCLASLRGLNKEDELFKLLEACGYLLLVADGIPGKMESILEETETNKRTAAGLRDAMADVHRTARVSLEKLLIAHHAELEQLTEEWGVHRRELKNTQDELHRALKEGRELAAANETILTSLAKLWIKEAAFVAMCALILGLGMGLVGARFFR